MMRSILLLISVGFALAFNPAAAATLQLSAIQKNGTPMPEVVIYVDQLDGSRLPASAPNVASVAQSGMQFVPNITIVRTGAKITFPNLDQVDHHVKSFSPTKEFELKISNATLPAVTFDSSGIVVLNCLLHEWMRGYILVIDSPFYAQLDANGRGEIQNIAPGRYTVHAWHPDLGTFLPTLEQEVVIAADGAATKFEFPFNARVKRMPHGMK